MRLPLHLLLADVQAAAYTPHTAEHRLVVVGRFLLLQVDGSLLLDIFGVGQADSAAAGDAVALGPAPSLGGPLLALIPQVAVLVLAYPRLRLVVVASLAVEA